MVRVWVKVRVSSAKSPASPCSVLATVLAADASAKVVVRVKVGVEGEGVGEGEGEGEATLQTR